MIITIFLVSSVMVVILVLLVVGFLLNYQKRLAQQKTRVQQMELDFQKDLLRETFNSQEKERQRIAKDLHDDVGAMLSTLRLFVSKLSDNVSPQTKEARLKELTFQTIDETIDSVRQISRDLMPPALEKLGLAYSLSHLAEHISSAGKINVNCQVNDSWERLPVEREQALFRIGQELVNNTLKHAQANQIQILLKVEDQQAMIQYADDGIGIAPALLNSRNRKGMGLRNIESRASLIGASTQWITDNDRGMAIHIRLPLANHEPANSPLT